MLPFIVAAGGIAVVRRDRAASRVAVLAAAFTAGAGVTALAITRVMARVGFVLPQVRADKLATADQAFRNLVLAGHGAWFVITGRSLTVSAPEGVVIVVLLSVLASVLVCLPLLAARAHRIGDPDLEFGHSLYVGYWSLVVSLTTLAFALSRFPDGLTSWRYLVPVYFGLAWLVVPLSASPTRATRPVALAAALYCAINVATLVSWNPVPIRGAPPDEMTTWLKHRGLKTGYASYVDAHILTRNSGGMTAVRPVLQGASCRSSEPGAICPYLYTAAASWYSGRATGPTFLVVHPADPGVDVVTALPDPGLGSPLEMRAIEGWKIFVYADDVAAHFLPGLSVPGQPLEAAAN
jgi:hypothetical protein